MSELFTDDELTNLEINNTDNTPVTVLGKTFANDNERRLYFREKLRKKLPELKKLEGYPIGEDDDIINLSDPPYYTACPNPWLNDFVAEWEKEKESPELKKLRKDDFEVKDPYASDVSEGKNNPIYMAHSYHTKVPHPAIMRYILHYTQPGDIVFDGFGGTGMTGVAAQMCGCPNMDLKNKIETEFEDLGYSKPIWGQRNAILGDLSPIASFISYNYNSPLSSKQFLSICKSKIEEVKNECNWMYETKHKDGTKGIINYVLLADVFVCDNCGSEVDFWKAAYDKNKKTINDTFQCPSCGNNLKKKTAKRFYYTHFDKELNKTVKIAKTVPAVINYVALDGKTYTKDADDFDIELVNKIESLKIPYFFPIDELPVGFNTKQPLNSHGYSHTHQFYAKRTLYVLACMWNKFPNWFFRMPITSVLLKTASLLHNVGFKDGKINLAGALPNVLFIPSVKAERNIITLVEGKIKDFDISLPQTRSIQQIASATNVNINDNSIDYIFTDPPFGANIMYSELNFIQESWLKVKTNNKEEAIENDVQNKGLLSYQGLMQKSFAEYYRILKPGSWITIEFSNTAAEVWNSIQLSLNRVGFIIANISALDKQQGSFKAQTTPTAVKQDLVISCYKPSETFTKQFMIQDSRANTWSFISEHLEHLPIPSVKDERTTSVIERSPKVLYDRLITYFFMRGLPVPLDAADFQEGLRNRYIQEDGMIFTSAQLQSYHELKKKHNITDQPSLFVDIIESENDAIQWIKEKLEAGSLKYQDIQPDYRKAYTINRKGEVEVELKDVLEENFIQEADGSWRIPDMNEQKDRDALRTKALLKIWEDYCSQVESGKVKKLKDVRLEAVKAGFKDCYQKKDFKRIVTIGDKIPENLLTEDETLLNYYDIACSKV